MTEAVLVLSDNSKSNLRVISLVLGISYLLQSIIHFINYFSLFLILIILGIALILISIFSKKLNLGDNYIIITEETVLYKSTYRVTPKKYGWDIINRVTLSKYSLDILFTDGIAKKIYFDKMSYRQRKMDLPQFISDIKNVSICSDKIIYNI